MVWFQYIYVILCCHMLPAVVASNTFLEGGVQQREITVQDPHVPSDYLLLIERLLLDFTQVSYYRPDKLFPHIQRFDCPAFDLVMSKPFLVRSYSKLLIHRDFCSTMVSIFIAVFSLLLYFYQSFQKGINRVEVGRKRRELDTFVKMAMQLKQVFQGLSSLQSTRLSSRSEISRCFIEYPHQ